MKIGTTHETAAAAAVTKTTADKSTGVQSGRSSSSSAPVQTEASRAATEAGTQVALSSEAATLLSSMGDDGSFDIEKVNRITQAIAEGKFTINAEAIAGKLIANAEELLDRSQSSQH